MTNTNELYHVVAVDLKTGDERLMKSGMTQSQAEAYRYMAVVRRGIEREIFLRPWNQEQVMTMNELNVGRDGAQYRITVMYDGSTHTAYGNRPYQAVMAVVREMVKLNPRLREAIEPVPMILHCPDCRARHIDKGDFAKKPHHTHSCQQCGLTWRPAVVDTVGVQFLPGFKDKE